MRDKAQALQEFWSSFGLPAYDAITVPDDAQMPYITYTVATDSMDSVLPLNASLWYRSSSWAEISRKAEEIARAIAEHGYMIYNVEGGYLWLVKGTPFAQRMRDENDSSIRRIYLNITAEYLTAY